MTQLWVGQSLSSTPIRESRIAVLSFAISLQNIIRTTTVMTIVTATAIAMATAAAAAVATVKPIIIVTIIVTIITTIIAQTDTESSRS